jgi:DNA sulfur modification protein DndB
VSPATVRMETFDLREGCVYLYNAIPVIYECSLNRGIRSKYKFSKLNNRHAFVELSTEHVYERVHMVTQPKTFKPEMIEGYNISALKRTGQNIFTATIPYGLIAQTFSFEDTTLPVEERSQRMLDVKHAMSLKRFIEEHPHEYLPPMIVAVYGKFDFKPFAEDANNGLLKIGLGSRLVNIDGQHRTYAIKQILLKPDSQAIAEIGITVDFLMNPSLSECQQVFRRVNGQVKAVSKNLLHLYSSSSEDRLVNSIISQVPLFRDVNVEKNKTSLAAKSPKLFVYKRVADTTRAILPGHGEVASTAFALAFWNTLIEVIPQFSDRTTNATEEGNIELRSEYLCFTAIALNAFAKLGKENAMFGTEAEKLAAKLKSLEGIDWSKSNPHFLGRIVDPQGKMLTKAANLGLLVNYLKWHMGAPRGSIDIQLEKAYIPDSPILKGGATKK